jgi:hypothetical protein
VGSWGGLAEGDFGVQEEVDGLLDGDGCGQGLEVEGGHAVVHVDGFEHDDAEGEVHVELGVDPAVGGGLVLVELDDAAGVDASEDAPAEVDGFEDAAVDAGHAVGAGVDPDAAGEAGEEVGGEVGRVEGGVGFEVEDDLGVCDVGELGLAGGEGVEHGLRHEADELEGVVAGGAVALVVPDEVGGGVEDGLEAFAFGGVFGGGEGLAAALDEAGDAAVAGFDDFADDVAFGVDFVDAVAEGEGSVVVDDGQLVGGGGFDPGARGSGGLGRCGRLGLPGVERMGCGDAEGDDADGGVKAAAKASAGQRLGRVWGIGCFENQAGWGLLSHLRRTAWHRRIVQFRQG